jgi:hypothetical protein
METFFFDVRLNDGTLYRIECTRVDIDKLTNLIGENNITQIEEL